ncbi:MAG: serine hydrolase domain-containing protein [Chryseolinea sp.]
MKIIPSFVLLCILIPSTIIAQKLVPGKPEEVGLSVERLAKIDDLLNEGVTKKWFPGVSVLIVRKGKIVFHKAYGVSDLEKKTPLKKDDIFRIASQTKAITSTAVMMLYEEGKLLLDDPLSKYIPEFKDPMVLDKFKPTDSSFTSHPAKSEITIRQLLTHTSGIDYAAIGSDEFKAIYGKAKIPTGLDLPMGKLGPNIKALGKLPLKANPGEEFIYSLSTDVLGYVVEVVSGNTLDEFFHKRIFEPLSMNDTYFYIPREKHSRLVKAYIEGKDGFENLGVGTAFSADYPLVAGTYFGGGGGLSSTMEDYAKFLQMFLNGGRFNGQQLLGRKTIELMLTNQTHDLEMQFGLGFQLETTKNDYQSPKSIGSFSWGGAFSTMYWADPKEKIIGILYRQILPNAHNDTGNKFQSLVYSAIVD